MEYAYLSIYVPSVSPSNDLPLFIFSQFFIEINPSLLVKSLMKLDTLDGYSQNQ